MRIVLVLIVVKETKFLETKKGDDPNFKNSDNEDLEDYKMPDDYAETYEFVEIPLPKKVIEKKVRVQKPRLTKEMKVKQLKKQDKFFVARMFIMTFALAVVFTVITQTVLSGGSLIISFTLLFALVGISIIFDVIGTSAASCDIQPFISKAARKDKSATVAVKLLKNAEKVSSFCNDVVGDICGIVSGGCASAIIMSITVEGTTQQIIINIVLSSIVSAMTVGGKAIGKLTAIRSSEKIITMVAKVMGVFKK